MVEWKHKYKNNTFLAKYIVEQLGTAELHWKFATVPKDDRWYWQIILTATYTDRNLLISRTSLSQLENFQRAT